MYHFSSGSSSGESVQLEPLIPSLKTHKKTKISNNATVTHQIHFYHHLVGPPIDGTYPKAMPNGYQLQDARGFSVHVDASSSNISSSYDCRYMYSDPYPTVATSHLATVASQPNLLPSLSGFGSQSQSSKNRAIPSCLDSLLSTTISAGQQLPAMDTLKEKEKWSSPPSLPSMPSDGFYPSMPSDGFYPSSSQSAATFFDSTFGSNNFPKSEGLNHDSKLDVLYPSHPTVPHMDVGSWKDDCLLSTDQEKYSKVVIAKQQACLLKLRSEMLRDKEELRELREDVFCMERELSKRDRTKPNTEMEKAHNAALAELRQLRTEVRELTHQVDMIKLPLGVVEPDEESFYHSLDEKASSGELSSLEGACGGSSNKPNVPATSSHPDASDTKPGRPNELNVKETDSLEEVQLCDISPLVYDEACGHSRWSCGGCTFLNHGDLHICEMCNTQRVPCELQSMPVTPCNPPLARSSTCQSTSDNSRPPTTSGRASRTQSLPPPDISDLETFEPNDDDDDTVIIFHKGESLGPTEVTKSLR